MAALVVSRREQATETENYPCGLAWGGRLDQEDLSSLHLSNLNQRNKLCYEQDYDEISEEG